jgi:phosphonate transport system ATP-binding protein
MIKVEDLGVVYGGNSVALRRTNITFHKGAFAVLLGASGAGKSTLLRSLNGLVTPSEGRVRVEELGCLSDRRALREHRRSTGMVFQQHQLIGRLTVLQNVLMGRLGYHPGWRTILPFPKSERELALGAIERVGLIDFALRRADELSGGQQQRVGIARALVQKPKLILADEPVASLDPTTAEAVLTLLRRVCREDGLTAIVSLHQVELARAFADRIIALAGGSVVFDGLPDGLEPATLDRIYKSNVAAAISQRSHKVVQHQEQGAFA